jgi:hypothetical protein
MEQNTIHLQTLGNLNENNKWNRKQDVSTLSLLGDYPRSQEREECIIR